MNLKLQRLIEPKAGLNFLVPSKWVHQFFLLNQEHSEEISSTKTSELNQVQLQKLLIPYYDPTPNLDAFILEFKSQIIEQINHKCNFINFNMSVISLQPNQASNWTVVSARFWNLIKSKLQISQMKIQATFTYLNQLNSFHNYPQILSTCQIQIVFCAKKQVTVFIGYLPKKSSLANVVQEIGNYLGFFDTYQTKISFPAKNSEQSFSFYQTKLKNMSLQSASDNLILVFNLESHQNKADYPKQNRVPTPMEIANQCWQNGQALPQQNQTAGYRNTSQNVNATNRSNSNRAIVNDGTQSTGADSFSFQQAYFNPISNQNCQNLAEGSQTLRIPELLKNLQYQDVHAMKSKAKQAIYGVLLQIPDISQQRMQEQLQILAEQIISSGDFRKKKISIPMSVQKPEKGWLLQGSNFEIIPGYGQPLIDQSEDTEN